MTFSFFTDEDILINNFYMGGDWAPIGLDLTGVHGEGVLAFMN